MDVLRVAAWLLGLYLAGVFLFLGLMYAWLAADPRRSPRARPGRAFWSEVGWAAATEWTMPLAFFLWPHWWRRGRTEVAAPAAGAPPEPSLPVVMVHGWGQNRADFWGLGWRLRRRTRHPLYAFDYWFFGPVERSAARLGRVVDRACRDHGADRVHLVCHSLGGLVARTFVEAQGGAARVASVTFIGSPLHGTHRAGTGLGRATRQMTPGSPFLGGLGPARPPAGVVYHSAWSHSDQMVLPSSSASLQGQGPELELDDAGHLGLLYRAEVGGQVVAWLAAAEGQAWSAARDAPPMAPPVCAKSQ